VEEKESLEIPACHLAYNRRRVRQVIALFDKDVLHAMSTDDPILMMQASFPNSTPRRADH